MSNLRAIRTLAHAIELDAQLLALKVNSVTVSAPDGFPSTASGSDNGPRGHSELTGVEAAAHTRLGDLTATTGQQYRPGIVTKLADLHELQTGIRDLQRRALAITDSLGAKADINYDALRCIGTGDQDGATCTQWQDPRRRDGRCLDCGNTIDHDDDRKARRAANARRRYHDNKIAS